MCVQVLDLQQAMVPLEQKSSEYETKVQSLEGEKISLNQAVEHWKQRVNNLLQKHSQERAEDETKQKWVTYLNEYLTLRLLPTIKLGIGRSQGVSYSSLILLHNLQHLIFVP